jgi:hypothetical protein
MLRRTVLALFVVSACTGGPGGPSPTAAPSGIDVASGSPIASPPRTATPTGPPPAATLTAGAPASAAGSLVYIVDFNVWVAAPDGSGSRQLTTDGTESTPYHDPTQADDGTVYALRGSRSLVRIDRAGAGPAATVDLPTLENGAEGLDVSPDGAHIAYVTTGYGTTIDPRFGTPSGTFLYGGTDIATVDGESIAGAALATLLYPGWFDDQHVVVADGVALWFDEVGKPPATWLSQSDGCEIELDCPSGTPAEASLSTPAISRDGKLLAYSYKPFFGPAGRRIAWVPGALPEKPTTRCLLPNQEDYNDPGTFKPDATAFAFDDTRFDPDTFDTTRGKGISVLELDLAAADCGGTTAQLVIAGGTQPEWGQAAP